MVQAVPLKALLGDILTVPCVSDPAVSRHVGRMLGVSQTSKWQNSQAGGATDQHVAE